MHALSSGALPPSASRYTIFGQIGSGGMATVHYAQFEGPAGFKRAVAIKRLHPHLAEDPGFASMFLDEARLSARIQHANVVATLDVLSSPGEISVVLEYVHGESLASLVSLSAARGAPMPASIASTLVLGVLHGLHAAHETRGEDGEVLGIVHRDVSPENILVGRDGLPRLLDFGIAKARGRARSTPSGELKGKLGYMAPEQFLGKPVDRRMDVYSSAVVLWEALTGRLLFQAESDAALVREVIEADVPSPGEWVDGVSPELSDLVLRGLARDREQRFASAREMALALERLGGLATQSEVSDWLQHLAGARLNERAQKLSDLRRAALGGASTAPLAGTRRLPMGASEPPAVEPGASGSIEGRGSMASGTRERRSALRPLLALLVVGLVAVGSWLASRLLLSGPMTDLDPTPPPLGARPGVPAESEPVPANADLAAQALPGGEQRTPTSELGTESATPPPDLGAEPVAVVPPPVSPNEGSRDAHPARASAPETNERPDVQGEGSSPSPSSDRRYPPRPQLDPCAQPYFVDSEGIRHWKRQCL